MAICESIRLVGVPGSNKVMEGEANRIAPRVGLPRPNKPKKAGTGALVYELDDKLAWGLVWYHRTSSRILYDLYESTSQRTDEFYDEIKRDISSDGRNWLTDGASFSIRARNLDSYPSGAGQVVGAAKNALIDGAAAAGKSLRLNAEDPDLELALRLHDDVLTISVELSRGGRHHRDYRLEGGEAPMRENLASMLVMLSRWNARSEALIDPMTGSGTIAIEAALMAKGAPLWRDSRYITEGIVPGLKTVPTEGLFADTSAAILASELHPGRARGAVENSEAATVSDSVEVKHGDFRHLDPDVVKASLEKRGWDGVAGVILCNPPYGQRMAVPIDLYEELGNWCRQFRGWRVGVLVANREFDDAFGMKPRVQKPLKNGNQLSRFLLYDM